MSAIDAIAISIIASLIFYAIKRIDEMDKRVDERLDSVDERLDSLESRLTGIESYLPKQRRSDHYFSPNSGIEL